MVRTLKSYVLPVYTSSARFVRYSLLTACFSHENAGHILFNGFTFYFMAPLVISILGNVGFLGLYLGSMCSGCIAPCVTSDPLSLRDRRRCI